MLSQATPDALDAGGLPALRQALVGAFARPGGSIDLSLRELAVLIVAVQRPGQTLRRLAEQTGLTPAGVRRAVDCLRRAGLLTGQADTSGDSLALVPTAPGQKVVRDMVRGMSGATSGVGVAPARTMAEAIDRPARPTRL